MLEENQLLFKILISIVVFVSITYLVYYYQIYLQNEEQQKQTNKQDEFIESFLEFSKNIDYEETQRKKDEEYYFQDDGFNIEPLDMSVLPFYRKYATLEEGFQEGFQEGLKMPKFPSIGEIGKSVENALKKPLKPLLDFINKVKKTFTEIGKRVNMLKTSFDKVGNAIKLQFVNLGKSIKTEFDDIGNIANGGIKCGVHYVSNFRDCITYYLIDMVLQVIYSIFIGFPLWIFKITFKIDTTEYVKTVKNITNEMDKIIVSILGFSIFHFPSSVLDTCYSCKNVNFNKLINKLKKDNNETIPRWMNEPTKLFKEAGRDFRNAFRPIK